MLAKDHANPAPGPYKQHSPPVHKTQPPIWLCGLRETMNAFPSPQRNKKRNPHPFGTQLSATRVVRNLDRIQPALWKEGLNGWLKTVAHPSHGIWQLSSTLGQSKVLIIRALKY